MKKLVFLFFLVLVGVSATALYVTHAQDNIPPRVVAVDPRNGAENVPTNANIHVYFSEPMDPSSITTNTFTVSDSGGNSLDGEMTYANSVAAFVLFEHMDEMSNYTVNVSGRVTDYVGNPLGGDYSWTFQTASD